MSVFSARKHHRLVIGGRDFFFPLVVADDDLNQVVVRLSFFPLLRSS